MSPTNTTHEAEGENLDYTPQEKKIINKLERNTFVEEAGVLENGDVVVIVNKRNTHGIPTAGFEIKHVSMTSSESGIGGPWDRLRVTLDTNNE